jgi:hypothetical protein
VAFKRSKYSNTQPGNAFSLTGVINPEGEEPGFKRLGVNLLVGMDVYLIRRLYIGTELGYGFSSTHFTDVELSQGTGSQTFEGDSSKTFGLIFNRAFRLGFFFN